jgi:hypothetical protein
MDQLHISHLPLTENLRRHLRTARSLLRSMAPAELEVWVELARLKVAEAGVAHLRLMALL